MLRKPVFLFIFVALGANPACFVDFDKISSYNITAKRGSFQVSLGLLTKYELALLSSLRTRWSHLSLYYLFIYRYYLVVLKALFIEICSAGIIGITSSSSPYRARQFLPIQCQCRGQFSLIYERRIGKCSKKG